MLGLLEAIAGTVVLFLGLWVRVVLASLGRNMHTSATEALQQLLDAIRDTGTHMSVIKAHGFQGWPHDLFHVVVI